MVNTQKKFVCFRGVNRPLENEERPFSAIGSHSMTITTERHPIKTLFFSRSSYEMK